MRVRDDYRSLTGKDKAAVLMLSLGDEFAAKLFANMEAAEIRELSQSMSELGTVSAVIVEQLFVEFSEKISSPGDLIGTPESTDRLLKKVIGQERGDKIMNSVQGPEGRTMWEKLDNINEQLLANYLKNEYPQTVAVVLAKLQPEHAAKVMARHGAAGVIIGSPIRFASVGHGSALDIAGQGIANPDAMIEAIRWFFGDTQLP